MKETNIGKYVIVRGDRSGVFAGTLADRDGQEWFHGSEPCFLRKL